MPIYRPADWLNDENRPTWCGTTAAGRFTIPFGHGRFDRHHHDVDEFWFISDGRAKIVVDGAEQYVQSGDIVLTRAGDAHDIIEVYQELHGFFLESGHPPALRFGHLHTSETDAAGHSVLAVALPDDFPLR